MTRNKRLAQRRAMLVLECNVQRTMLAIQGRQFGLNTGWIKSDEGMLSRLKNMPGWAGVLLSAVIAIFPGKMASFARSGLMLWQLWRSLKSGDEKESPASAESAKSPN